MMNRKLDTVSWKTGLFESTEFGQLYKDIFNVDSSVLQSTLEFEDIQDIYQTILNNCPDLTDFQTRMISGIFSEFDKIRKIIDPDRLNFDWNMNQDGEFLLYRRSKLGLTNVIVHDEDCIAYSFISSNPEKQNTLEFYYDPVDFQKVALTLFAK